MVSNGRQKYLREVYIARINRVIDYIQNNLGEPLSPELLADIAGFSRFHFHRIFNAIIGETLSAFIQRIRIEKAAAKLISNPKKKITDIAFECGFSSSSVFARTFKEAFTISASEWCDGGYKNYSKESKQDSNNSQTDGKIRQDFNVYPDYTAGDKQIWRVDMKGKKLNTTVEVKDMPDITVAYVRHIGPYKGDVDLFGRLFGKLCTWAGPRGLLIPETKFISLYHDDPEITDESRLRTDVCVSVPTDTVVDGEIGKEIIPAGKYAITHFEITVDQYEDAWNTVFGGWLPESGYECVDGPCYELCYQSNKEDPAGKQIVDICIPVKPL